MKILPLYLKRDDFHLRDEKSESGSWVESSSFF